MDFDKAASHHQAKAMMMRCSSFLILCVLCGQVALANIRYVDSSVGSSGNGQSWATAWKNLSNISGVSSNDTVYISGGPSGSSQTYSVSSWSPASATYQIGQDSAHNGTAIFSGTGLLFAGSPNNTVFSGYVTNDTAKHFQLSGYSAVIGGTGEASVNNFRFCYVNMGDINPGAGTVFQFDTYNNLELDHLWCRVTGMNGDGWCVLNNGGASGWDSVKIHHNTILIPVASESNPNGVDGIRWGGNGGVSVYNCSFIGYYNGYSGGQHQDGCQVMAGPYNKLYNNYYYRMGNSGIYASPAFTPLTYTYIYNNIAVACHDFGIYCIVETDAHYRGITNCVLANNLCESISTSVFDMIFGDYNTSGTYSNNRVANNIVINATGEGHDATHISTSGSCTEDHTIFLTSLQAATNFANYIPASTNSDFRLKSGATSLIGQASSMSSYFTVDIAGNSRGATWDIGPYQYWPTNIYITPAITSLTNGTCVALHAWGIYPGSATNELTTNGVTWSSILSNLISVTTDGVVCGLQEGGVSDITATYGNVSGIISLRVNDSGDIYPPILLQIKGKACKDPFLPQTNAVIFFLVSDDKATNILSLDAPFPDPPVASFTNAVSSEYMSNYISSSDYSAWKAAWPVPTGVGTPFHIQSIDPSNNVMTFESQLPFPPAFPALCFLDSLDTIYDIANEPKPMGIVFGQMIVTQ